MRRLIGIIMLLVIVFSTSISSFAVETNAKIDSKKDKFTIITGKYFKEGKPLPVQTLDDLDVVFENVSIKENNNKIHIKGTLTYDNKEMEINTSGEVIQSVALKERGVVASLNNIDDFTVEFFKIEENSYSSTLFPPNQYMWGCTVLEMILFNEETREVIYLQGLVNEDTFKTLNEKAMKNYNAKVKDLTDKEKNDYLQGLKMKDSYKPLMEKLDNQENGNVKDKKVISIKSSGGVDVPNKEMKKTKEVLVENKTTTFGIGDDSDIWWSSNSPFPEIDMSLFSNQNSAYNQQFIFNPNTPKSIGHCYVYDRYTGWNAGEMITEILFCIFWYDYEFKSVGGRIQFWPVFDFDVRNGGRVTYSSATNEFLYETDYAQMYIKDWEFLWTNPKANRNVLVSREGYMDGVEIGSISSQEVIRSFAALLPYTSQALFSWSELTANAYDIAVSSNGFEKHYPSTYEFQQIAYNGNVFRAADYKFEGYKINEKDHYTFVKLRYDTPESYVNWIWNYRFEFN